MLDNKDFFPTPKALSSKMLTLVDWSRVKTTLEPSAGSGDLLSAVTEHNDYPRSYHRKTFCIEKDEELRAMLVGKGETVIDSDFLNYYGQRHFDLIFMNPPFSEGDKHLLKAIEVLYSGQIVCLLNAETLKNPYSHGRKELVKKLDELGAKIDYVSGAFTGDDSKRKTNVETAIVYISVENSVESDIMGDVRNDAVNINIDTESNEVAAAQNDIDKLLEEYNAVVKNGQSFLQHYFQKHYLFEGFIRVEGDDTGTIDSRAKEMANSFHDRVRYCFWKKALDLKEVSAKMTQDERSAFHERIEKQCNMEFTGNNIRAFLISLCDNYHNVLTRATLKLFDTMTIKSSYHKEVDNGNVHLFNGWKTNDAFKVREKVVLDANGGGYGDTAFFRDAGTSWAKWSLHYNTSDWLNDIDKVMDYFTPKTLKEDDVEEPKSIAQAIENALESGQTKKIKSFHFTVTVFKKGTIHLKFNDADTLRRFNIEACKGKNFIPKDYGSFNWDQLTQKEKDIAEKFDGEKTYCENVGNVGFALSNDINSLLLGKE
jgi:hypothetical protein